MRLRLASGVGRSRQTIDAAEIDGCTVPNGECDPFPEDFEVEVDALLASSVQSRILIDVLVVHVLFNAVGKQTLPRCPDCIIHSGQPLSKEDLP